MMRAFLSLLFLGSTLAIAEIEDEIPLGIEAVTGIRSTYAYRGAKLADTLVDFQLEAEIVSGKGLVMNAGGWFSSESGGPGFSEFAAFLDVRLDINDLLTIGASTTYHDFDKAILRDGIDTGIFATFYATEDIDFTFGAYHDFGNDAWYVNSEASWSPRLGDDAYFGLMGGISWVDGFIGRSGMNDFYGRASLTYNINNAVSLTPFVGWSMLMDSSDPGDDEIFGGLWFEVIF